MVGGDEVMWVMVVFGLWRIKKIALCKMLNRG